jgi:Family of unknown function (DUF6636)
VRQLLTLVAIAGLCLTAGCGTDSAQQPSSQANVPPSPAATVTVTATPETTPDTTPDTTPAPTLTRTSRPKPAPVDLSRYDLPGFTTPTGNIGCQFDDHQGAHVRCDRLQMSSVPGGRPADCDFDWGHSVELSAGGRGALACTSDSVMGQQGETDGTRALPYGDSVRYRGIVCTSTRQGLRCSTSGGHGFLISRETIRVR